MLKNSQHDVNLKKKNLIASFFFCIDIKNLVVEIHISLE